MNIKPIGTKRPPVQVSARGIVSRIREAKAQNPIRPVDLRGVFMTRSRNDIVTEQEFKELPFVFQRVFRGRIYTRREQEFNAMLQEYKLVREAKEKVIDARLENVPKCLKAPLKAVAMHLV